MCSFQDTVIGIYALSQLAVAMSSKRVNLIVNVTTDDASHKFTVNEENMLVFQKYEVTFFKNCRQESVSVLNLGILLLSSANFLGP